MNQEAPITAGREMVSRPYLLDDAAAHAYDQALEKPPRRRPPANIHNDADAASKAGFRGPIAGGEQTYAVVMNFLAECYGENLYRGSRIEAAFIKPVFYGDRLTTHLRVTSESESAIEVEIWTENDRGERVLVANGRIPRSIDA